MNRLIASLPFAVVILALAGCGAVPLEVARSGPVLRGSLAGAGDVTWLGTDFTDAVFADIYMVPDQVVTQKIPDWNERIAARALAAGTTAEGVVLLPITQDLTASKKANKTAEPDQVTAGLPSPAAVAELRAKVARPLDTEAAAARVKPYLGGKGVGVLLVIDGALKDVGTGGAWIVFDRESGVVHFTGRALTRVGGMGVFNYYGNGFYRLAEAAIADLVTATSTAPATP